MVTRVAIGCLATLECSMRTKELALFTLPMLLPMMDSVPKPCQDARSR